jgi:pimeloyl-ACP methyl ester carboxylesterase
MPIERFEVHVPDAVLDDVRHRLVDARGVDALDGNAGLRRLVDHWRTGFDWRAAEARINRFAQFRAVVGGLHIHFLHERGRGPRPLPIVLTHGFPDSFLRFVKLIPLLTDPAGHGGDPADAFDVVVPSLPGYGFSDPPDRPGLTFHIGDIWHELMTDVLGYDRFGAHGGDWGSTVTEHLARSHAHAVIGIHLTDIPFWHMFQRPSDASPAEQGFLAANQRWMESEGAYAMIQGTRPQTLAQALNDSPIGLAAWLVEKFERWSDCHGDVHTRFSDDELVTNAMLYWVTGTIGSAFLPYYDFTHAGAMRWIVEKAKEWIGSSRVPTGFAQFPRDIGHPPREWIERFHDLRRYTAMPRGGHFAALEEPELLADELRAFFRPLRSSEASLHGR